MRKFGFELECLIPNTHISQFEAGSYNSAGIHIKGAPEGWVAKRDGSLQSRIGFTAVEVVGMLTVYVVA